MGGRGIVVSLVAIGEINKLQKEEDGGRMLEGGEFTASSSRIRAGKMKDEEKDLFGGTCPNSTMKVHLGSVSGE